MAHEFKNDTKNRRVADSARVALTRTLDKQRVYTSRSLQRYVATEVKPKRTTRSFDGVSHVKPDGVIVPSPLLSHLPSDKASNKLGRYHRAKP